MTPRVALATICLLSSVVVTVGTQLAGVQPAGAAISCGTLAFFYNDEMGANYNGYWEGVSADIINLEGALCGSGDEYQIGNGIYENDSSEMYPAYIFSGMFRDPGANYYFYWDESGTNGTDETQATSGSPLASYGLSNHFWVSYTTNASYCAGGHTPCIFPVINSDHPVLGIPVSAISTGYSDLIPVTSGQLDYLGSDQPGSSSSPTTIDGLQYQVSHTDPEGSGEADTFISDMNDYGGLQYFNDSGTTSSTCDYEHRWGYTKIDYSDNDAALYAQTTGNGSC